MTMLLNFTTGFISITFDKSRQNYAQNFELLLFNLPEFQGSILQMTAVLLQSSLHGFPSIYCCGLHRIAN